jgi:hypothetical protein
VSFQEFALYYQSTVQVTERRIAMNRWNYSVLTATLIAIALVLNWSTDKQSHMFVGVCGIVILCLMAVVLCTYWINQISDAKNLNSAKFKVLAEMAPLVVFDGSDGPSPARSWEPFEKEWSELQAAQALTQVKTGPISKLQVLNASRAEYFIPQAFRVLFAIILLGTVTFAALEHSAVFHRMNPYSGVTSDTGAKK